MAASFSTLDFNDLWHGEPKPLFLQRLNFMVDVVKPIDNIPEIVEVDVASWDGLQLVTQRSGTVVFLLSRKRSLCCILYTVSVLLYIGHIISASMSR